MSPRKTFSYEQLFTLNPLPMYLCDVDTLEVLEVNQAAVAFYGYSRTEFLAMSLLDFRPTDECRAMLVSLEQFKQEGSHSGIWRHTKKDGTVVSVEVNAALLALAQRRIGLVVVRYLVYPIYSLHGLEKPELVRLIAQQNQAIAKLEELMVRLLKEQPNGGQLGHA